MDDEDFQHGQVVVRDKCCCYKCRKQYETEGNFPSVSMFIVGQTVEHITYRMCPVCTGEANSLLEKWCMDEVPV